MAELVFYRRGEQLMRVRLDASPLVVGRGCECDVLVPDPQVSRRQLVIEPEGGGGWRLRDLSGRGTDIAGSPRLEASLKDGVDIGLGQWRALYQLAEAGDAAETTAAHDPAGTRVLERSEPATYGVAPPSTGWLRVAGPGGEQAVPLRGAITIGTAESCEVRLEDPFVSARHAQVERRGAILVVRDLGSRNGTWAGPLRLYEAELPLGCALRIGESELTFVRAPSESSVGAFEGLIGAAPSMRKVFTAIERVAPSLAAVAIYGESGTGKELVARAIHARSPRANRPFVPVNCGALSRELVESELFGHEKGAFTGADRLRKGAFEEADGGTLFLDEIGELPLGSQAKLLRALELGEIKRVGATRPLTVDVRIVAATNRDLRLEVRRGAFREDLYWRLCVVPLQLPPLRARREDVRALVAHFLKIYAPASAEVRLTPEAERKLLVHDWPGNVRELRNAIHRSLLLRRGEAIDAADVIFDRELGQAERVAEEELGASQPPDPDAEDLTRIHIVNKSFEQIEDEVFLKSFRRLGSSPSVLARALRVSRGAVYRHFSRLGIAPGEPEAA